jgi:hypothetical protein
MKRNHLLPILLLAVGLTITSEHSVRAAGNKQAAEQATILVKQALQAEVNGDAAERERLLAEALKLDPNCAAAHWQLGEVRRGAKWLKIENVPQDIENDRLLRAYRERRDALVDTADDHRELARWCEKRRLPEQARVHWARVLEFEPQNAEARQKGASAEADGNGTSLARKEAARRRQAEQTKNLQAWQPKLREWRDAFKTGGLDDANRVIEEISKINDPTAAPALQAALGQRDFQEPRLHEALYQGLGNLRLPEVTQYFVNLAMYGEGSERDAAIMQLKRRPMYVFVPQLLAAIPPEVKTKFNIYVLPSGGVLHEHEVTVATQDADYSYKVDNFMQPADLAAARRTTPGAVVREVSRASVIENEARRVEVQASDLRNRIRDVLRQTTSLEIGENAFDWRKQYEDYMAMYAPERERNYYPQVVSNREAPFTAPVRTEAGVLLSQAPENYECFVAGTPVLTDLGPKAIETIKPGDRVLAQNIQTGELSYQPILQTTVRPPTAIVEVRCAGSEPISSAAGHPFWVVGKGWQLAKFLKPGDRLRSTRGSVTIDSTEAKHAVEAYNLVVDGLHTYFVGEGQLLVHDNAPLPEQPQSVPGL